MGEGEKEKGKERKKLDPSSYSVQKGEREQGDG